MARFFYDADADLSVLDGRVVGVIGYGNQGRAQALNLRDSGVEVVVGSIEDASFDRAEADGFPVMATAVAAGRADVLLLLLPDEAQRAVYERDVAPRLRAGQALCFAHGYNIRFGYIRPPGDVDVILVAPRMIGVGVREMFVEGRGVPAFVAVEQDATRRAWPTALALARGIGAARAGVLATTFAEETELDLFSEQAFWPAVLRLLTLSFETLSARGYQPEAVLLELYASGEAARVFQKMAQVGLFRQMQYHSQTSQYGTLTRGERLVPDEFKERLDGIIAEIIDGRFAAEWAGERDAGYPVFERLHREALAHPLNEAEDRLRQQVA